MLYVYRGHCACSSAYDLSVADSVAAGGSTVLLLSFHSTCVVSSSLFEVHIYIMVKKIESDSNFTHSGSVAIA